MDKILYKAEGEEPKVWDERHEFVNQLNEPAKKVLFTWLKMMEMKCNNCKKELDCKHNWKTIGKVKEDCGFFSYRIWKLKQCSECKEIIFSA